MWEGQKAATKRCCFAFAALLVVVAFFAFSDVVVGRITERGLSDQGRPAVLNLTIKSILSAPVLGLGYGTFSSAFPMFRDDSVSILGFWDKAHNTYIEIFQGLGLLFGAMLIASVAVLVFDCLKAAIKQKRGCNHPGHRGKRLFPCGGACLDRLQLANSGGDIDLYGCSGCRGGAGRDPSSHEPARGGRSTSSSSMKEPS